MSHLRASEEPSGRTAEGQLIGCLSGESSCKEASVLTSQGQPHMNVWMLSVIARALRARCNVERRRCFKCTHLLQLRQVLALQSVSV